MIINYAPGTMAVRMEFDKRSGKFRQTQPDRNGRRFLRGPVPLDWLEHAARLNASALSVGVALWYLAGVTRSHTSLALSNERLKSWGVTRYTKRRALKRLEDAGLIRAVYRKGKSPVIDLRKVEY